MRLDHLLSREIPSKDTYFLISHESHLLSVPTASGPQGAVLYTKTGHLDICIARGAKDRLTFVNMLCVVDQIYMKRYDRKRFNRSQIDMTDAFMDTSFKEGSISFKLRSFTFKGSLDDISRTYKTPILRSCI